MPRRRRLGGSDFGGDRRHRSSDARERGQGHARQAGGRQSEDHRLLHGRELKTGETRASGRSGPASTARGRRAASAGHRSSPTAWSSSGSGMSARRSSPDGRRPSSSINAVPSIPPPPQCGLWLRTRANERRGWKRIKQQLNDGRIALVIGGPEPHRGDKAVAPCIDCFGPTGVECAASFAANADCRSDRAAWKAPASDKQTVGRWFKQAPTSCSRRMLHRKLSLGRLPRLKSMPRRSRPIKDHWAHSGLPVCK